MTTSTIEVPETIDSASPAQVASAMRMFSLLLGKTLTVSLNFTDFLRQD